MQHDLAGPLWGNIVVLTIGASATSCDFTLNAAEACSMRRTTCGKVIFQLRTTRSVGG